MNQEMNLTGTLRETPGTTPLTVLAVGMMMLRDLTIPGTKMTLATTAPALMALLPFRLLTEVLATIAILRALCTGLLMLTEMKTIGTTKVTLGTMLVMDNLDRTQAQMATPTAGITMRMGIITGVIATVALKLSLNMVAPTLLVTIARLGL